MKILFVCLGNICRSPTAEGFFRKELIKNGLQDKVQVDSCGTAAYHVGDPPDSRAQSAALGRGVDISGLRGRQINHQDFTDFDLILTMDHHNFDDLMGRCPEAYKNKINMFLSYSKQNSHQNVPDPYYGGPKGFELVLDLMEDAANGIIEVIRNKI